MSDGSQWSYSVSKSESKNGTQVLDQPAQLDSILKVKENRNLYWSTAENNQHRDYARSYIE
ncbi:hypothetical protein CDAR_402281, partial [Caerostris darwini]